MEAIEAFRSDQPIIGLLIEILIVGLLAAGIWFVFSVLFALLYSALKESLFRAAAYFDKLGGKLLVFGRAVWQHANDSVATFIGQLSLKWAFVEQDTIIGERMAGVRHTVDDVGKRIERGLDDMRSSMDSLRGAVEGLAAPTTDFEHSFGQTTTDQIRDAARLRRTALVVLIFVTPVLLALVGLNTAMLAKFFESFVDEWLSFRWGIRLSAVLGFFMSVLEISLGILLYYSGRSKDPGSILPAMKQLLFITLIVLLALIETYLYYRLSLEMTAERGGTSVADGLPTWVHSGWLAPFGPVLVIALSAMGHVLMAAINQFVDAGLQKSQQKLLDEMRRTWTSLMKSGTELQKRVSEVKTRCTQFISGLAGSDDPTTAVAIVEKSLSRLIDTLDTAKKARLNPYVAAGEGEASRTFAVLSLKTAALVFVALVFCWVQLLYTPAAAFLSIPFVLIAAAIVQAVAVLIAAYKIHSQVVLLLESEPAEVLRGTREAWTSAIAAVCILMVVLYNVALAGAFHIHAFQWIPFFLAMVCVAAFALIGRTIPAVAATAKLWLKVIVTSAIALVAWATSLLCWVIKVICRGVRAFLYVLAYPFLLVFWRKKLEFSEEPAVERT